MEKIFEGFTLQRNPTMISLEKRDGMARIATLEEYKLPLMVNFLEKEKFKFLNSIDFGLAPSPLTHLDQKRYEVLKSKDENFIVVSGLRTLPPRRIVETLTEFRLKDWRPLYTPALATPRNVPVLVYLGVDIVDNILPIMEAYKGIYMLDDVELSVESIKEFPCSCQVCSNITPVKLMEMEYNKRCELLALHNTLMLENQLRLVREQIRAENLRNFVEARSKTSTELSAMLRIADKVLFDCFPLFKRSKALFTTLELNRPELSLFFEKSLNAYRPLSKTLVILPCTATKPYSLSKTHRTLKRMVDFKGINELIVSSPLVSPREFELCYPVINYDTPVTGHWSEDEISFVAKKLVDFILKGNFELIIAHVCGGYRKVVEKASKLCGFDVRYTCDDELLSINSIENLKKEIEGSERISFSLYHEMFRHMVKYQFGLDFNGKYEIKGRYPRLELHQDKKRIMRMDVRYGMLDIDLAFARVLLEENRYLVKIDDFEPKGTIFASGILEADERIRPNDVVVFHNNKLYGVGFSRMCGSEMVELNKGYAIDVRRKCNLA
jgi:archaeosine synthase